MEIDFERFILRVDENRGVVYIDDKERGVTVLRICGLINQLKVTGEVYLDCDITFVEKGLLIGMSMPGERSKL